MYMCTKAVKKALLPVLVLGLTSANLLGQQIDSASRALSGDSVTTVANRTNGPLVKGTVTESATGKPLEEVIAK